MLLQEASRVPALEVVAAISPSAPTKTLSVAVAARFSDLSEAVRLVGLEAVVVAVPRSASVQVVSSSLGFDLHVLAEKPLGMLVDECDELYARARERSRVLLVDYTYLHHEGVQTLLAVAGARRTWHLELRVNDPGRQATAEDVVWDWGPHLVSLTAAFCGGQALDGEASLAFEAPQLVRDDDGWSLLLRTQSGCTGRLVLRSSLASKSRTLHFSTADLDLTVDLLSHSSAVSPVQASLRRFAAEVNRVREGGLPNGDQILTRVVTGRLAELVL